MRWRGASIPSAGGSIPVAVSSVNYADGIVSLKRQSPFCFVKSDFCVLSCFISVIAQSLIVLSGKSDRFWEMGKGWKEGGKGRKTGGEERFGA